MNWLKSLLQRNAKPAAPAAVTSLRIEPPDLFVLRLVGKLDKATLDRMQRAGLQAVERGVKTVKVLAVLTDFQGWRSGDNWGDIDFFIRHEKTIAKIAVVCDPKWESDMRVFLMADNRSGEVRFFSPGEEAQARVWLAK